MAFTVGAVVAKDGNSAAIGGGLLAADVAGGGVGPWFLFHGLVDGVAGSNKAQVTSNSALKVEIGPFNSGNVGATVPRVAIATDDVAIASVVTAVNNAAIGAGTAGTPSADVVTVQPAYADRTKKGRQKTQISNTSETTIVTAVAATYLDLYSVIISNNGATDADVTIRDNTAGTVVAILACPANSVNGFALHPDAAIAQAAVNTTWTAQADASTTLDITALFIKNT